jgi:membrane protease YdiL (CAAX protease family)
VVWLFAGVTTVLTIAVLLLVPGLGGPVIVVFIPTVNAAVLIRASVGRGQVKSLLFGARVWRVGLKWAVITLGLAALLRIAVSVVGEAVVADYEWRPGDFTPLLLGVFLFAAGEEIGWRGFALTALLGRGYRPLTATLLLSIPWALLHVPLIQPGGLNEGWSVWALLPFMVGLSVLVNWTYLASGLSVGAAVLFHGGQNALAVLNDGLGPRAAGWVMAAVYGTAALIVVVTTKGRLGQPPDGLARGSLRPAELPNGRLPS